MTAASAPTATGALLAGKSAAMVTYSPFPADPRPRRAAEALVEQGMSVDLICLAQDQAPRREKVFGVDVTRLPITRRRGGAVSYFWQYSTFLSLSGAILAARALRRRYDLVHVHNMPDFLVASAFAPKLLGAKVILDMHDPMPELMSTIFGLPAESVPVKALRTLERWSMAYADVVITVNEACSRIFASRSCAAEKIRVVMNSPDERIFSFRGPRVRPARRNTDRFVLLYHGSLVERNGLELAIDAMETVLDTMEDVELRICGRNTPFLQRMLDKAAARGLGDHVQYRGPKDLDEIAEEIEACDLGVIPNLANAFTAINTPTRLFEYLSLGKPAIAPGTPGIQDYFQPDALCYFRAGDAQDLARAIREVRQDPDRVADTVRRGQAVYHAHMWHAERQILVNTVANLVLEDSGATEGIRA